MTRCPLTWSLFTRRDLWPATWSRANRCIKKLYYAPVNPTWKFQKRAAWDRSKRDPMIVQEPQHRVSSSRNPRAVPRKGQGSRSLGNTSLQRIRSIVWQTDLTKKERGSSEKNGYSDKHRNRRTYYVFVGPRGEVHLQEYFLICVNLPHVASA